MTAPYHPNSSDGRILEHRYNMSIKLRRPLKPGEIVHHRYGDRQDNDAENLVLWSKPHPVGISSYDSLKKCMNLLTSYINIYTKEIKDYCRKILSMY